MKTLKNNLSDIIFLATAVFFLKIIFKQLVCVPAGFQATWRKGIGKENVQVRESPTPVTVSLAYSGH